MYLERSGELLEANRHLFRLREIVQQLAQAHLLEEVDHATTPLFGARYYFLKELTLREAEGLFWLMPALGPEFAYASFSEVTVQLTGLNSRGDVHAGTALCIAPSWLLTCGHVANQLTLDPVQDFAGHQFHVISSSAHPTIDVGLVEISPPMRAAPGLAFRNPVPGETVFALGYPRIPLSRAPALVMHRGEVTSPSVVTFSGHHLFLYSAVARPGNSGGPVVALTGSVVGIVSEELSDQAADAGQPFFAGIRATDLATAVAELEPSIALPIESFE